MEHDYEVEMLLGYLQTGRDALLWKLEGLSEYDVRRPLTPTGTNLLGIVKHVASVEVGYLTERFGRDPEVELPWFADDAPDNADMWATVDESRESIQDLYREVWRIDDASARALGPDAIGSVPWWGERGASVSVRQLLVHMIAETHRHAGHADILRERIDGEVGHRPAVSNMPDQEAAWWSDYVAILEETARGCHAAPRGVRRREPGNTLRSGV